MEVKSSEVTFKLACYTCELKTLKTRYFYMHFVLICTVVVSYCFVVCICVGFVMCVFVRALKCVGVLVICILYCD
jgi:hypothetical protein